MTPEQAAQIAVSERRTVSGLLCPKCSGGHSRERSMYVFPEGNGLKAIAYCARAKCGYRLEVIVNSNECLPTGNAHRNVAIHALVPMSVTMQETLYRLYGINHSSDLMQLRDFWACWIPVHNNRGNKIGGIVRRLDGRTPKAISYLYEHSTSPWMGFYTYSTVHAPGTGFIVEDMLSAIRLKQLNYNAVALLGTALSDEKVKAIKQVWNTAVLCLDADAFSKSIKYAQKYGIEACRLERDFKDSSDEEIRARVQQHV